eukprot:TRINITY_DN19402_c0_g1_i1.p1 TRINITY_DN19402_c0_g1~~TRINITY_DN19402_c0_g1_i1.p1  ORF type:complete len:238 (+),score=58.13 TRINITY_DN19402_c0_g1_i1:72-785(+)
MCIRDSINAEYMGKVTTEELLEHEKSLKAAMEAGARRRKIKQKLFEQELQLRRMQQRRLFVSPLRFVETAEDEDKEVSERIREERKCIREKMHNYAELVQQVNPIAVDQGKVEELKKRIESLKQPARKPKDAEEIKRMYSISNVVKSVNNKRTAFSNGISRTHDNKSPQSSYLNSSYDEGKRRKVDYLTVIREEHERYLRSKELSTSWKEDFNELEKDERNRTVSYTHLTLPTICSV